MFDNPSAMVLYGMPIKPYDSHTNRNYIVTAGALKGKLRFYFANIIVNDDVLSKKFSILHHDFYRSYKNEVRRGE